MTSEHITPPGQRKARHHQNQGSKHIGRGASARWDTPENDVDRGAPPKQLNSSTASVPSLLTEGDSMGWRGELSRRGRATQGRKETLEGITKQKVSWVDAFVSSCRNAWFCQVKKLQNLTHSPRIPCHLPWVCVYDCMSVCVSVSVRPSVCV